MRTRRRLALTALLAAAALAVAAFPFRQTWWGGWVLAIAEAGVVGGLADWFAVTAIFRHPLGLRIPHTALIPSNWEALAERVGAMVGNRVLTKQYVREELGRLDIADLLARGAERLSREDLEAATRAVARWAAAQVAPGASAELVTRIRRLLRDQPAAPTLAAALGVARRHGWDRRVIAGLVSTLADALDRPAFRATVADVIGDVLHRYRERLRPYPRLFLGVAELFGLVDRDRIVTALHGGLREVAQDPEHPLRLRAAEAVARLEARLHRDAALVARVEAAKDELLDTPAVTVLLRDLAGGLEQNLRRDLASDRPELVAWIADRLERARRALADDPALRADLDRWLKARVIDLVEQHHGRIAGFIENGVLALGPEGAVQLIEEHAGDDLQFIRVNGTVVGGLAGGGIYAIHLLVRAL